VIPGPIELNFAGREIASGARAIVRRGADRGAEGLNLDWPPVSAPAAMISAADQTPSHKRRDRRSRGEQCTSGKVRP